jgi:hypothetical protein
VSAKKLAWTVVVTGIVVAVLGSAFFLFRSREEATLNGTWIARMQRPGHAAYMLRFRLETSDRILKGEVEGFPIMNGTIENGRLNFSSTEAKYQGEVRGREIHLTSTTSDGIVAKGVARKIG